MEYIANTHGDYKFEFPRITVILGSNGTGKSTLLRAIKDAFPSVYVEGGRAIQIEDVIHLTRQNFNQYQNLDMTLNAYRGKRKSKLVDRLFDAMMVLILQEQAIKDAHSDAVVMWDERGQKGEPPKRPQPPLERLFEQFNEIFPNLTISYKKASGGVSVMNTFSDIPYGPSKLSDGEKQVFSLMADMLQIEDEYSVIVVDEPELNLHPELAERLWTLLESEYQDKKFIYATHSIQFAIRSGVEALYILSSDTSKIKRLDDISDIPREDMVQFLGGIPGILNSSTVVVTEGHEKSFDSLFYRWLLDDSEIEVFSCGNCNDVEQVIGKAGLWSQISSDICLTGVIDSDFRSNDQLKKIGDDMTILKLHEAESYICLPSIMAEAAKSIGSQDPLLSEDQVAVEIFSHLEKQKLSIALKRCFSDSTLTVRMSLERSQISSLKSKEEAMALIEDVSSDEIRKAVEAMSTGEFERRLDLEIANIEQILHDKNVNMALHFLPGKELLAKLAPRTGCKNGTDLMRSVKRNLDVNKYDLTAELKAYLKSNMTRQETEPEDLAGDVSLTVE